MAIPVDELHRIYERQNRWFAGRRNELLRRAGISRADMVVDVGCGTGVVTRELNARCRGYCVGVDMDRTALAAGTESRLQARVEQLPFAADSVDLVFAQLLFLWVQDLNGVAVELHRVLRPGGVVVVAAEPDFGGAIAYPGDDDVSDLMTRLAREGADPEVARKLGSALQKAGFSVECGVHSARPLKAALYQSDFASPELMPNRQRSFFFLPYFYFYGQKPLDG